VRKAAPGAAIGTGGAHTSARPTAETPATGDVAASGVAMGPSGPDAPVGHVAYTTPRSADESTMPDQGGPRAPTATPKASFDRQQRSSDQAQQSLAKSQASLDAPVGATANTVAGNGDTAASQPKLSEPVRTLIDSRLGAAQQAATALTGPSSLPHADVVATPAITAAPAEPMPVQSAVSGFVLGVLAAGGLAPLATNNPGAPVDSPVGWAVAAVVRRQLGDAAATQPANLGCSPTQTSQDVDPTTGAQGFAMTTATAASSAPSAAPTWDAPNAATGTVNGSINGSDADANTTLTYSLTGQPTGGTVSVNPQTGAFSYTPTQATRLAAGLTPGADTDSFTVGVSDGQTATAATVTVPISSTQSRLDPAITVGASPSGMVVSGNYGYVANQGSNTVSVIDVTTGRLVDTKPGTPSVVDPIAVGSAPTAVVAGTDGKSVYVANSASGSVSVISTATNTVTTTIKVGSAPQALALSANRLYVANAGSGTVSVIDTTTNKLVDVNPSTSAIDSIKVGSSPQGLAVSPDGTRLYVANSGSGTVSVINTATYKLVDTNPSTSTIDSIKVGSSPTAVAIAPDGSRVYVTNRGANTVSAIDTKTNTMTNTIAVGPQPSSVKISPDGSLAYVANGNDTISVINTTNNSLLSTVAVDPSAETGGHVVALSPDGTRIYVTDAVDQTVRVLSLVHVNTAPTVNGAPTVGTPDPTTGSVTGSLGATDIDGDKLSYTTASSPASGTVTYDPAAGTYTYTPTDAARQQAAQTTGDDYDHFTVAVSDGQAVTLDAVTVPISPQPAASPPQLSATTKTTAVGTNPTGVAISGSTVYVVNTGDYSNNGTVSVVDAATNQVAQTIPVGFAPTRAVASADGTRVYVANYDTVSVIDTTTNTVISTVAIPVQDGEYYNGVWDVAVSPDGTRVYAARGDGTVSIIDTIPTSPTYNQVISTTPVGFWDGDMELSSDGTRIYAADGVRDTVVVLDSKTMRTVGNIDAGPGPVDVAHNIAVSPDGNRAYVTEEVRVVQPASGGYSSGYLITDSQGNTWVVTGTYSAVSVIDTNPASATYNTRIATITVPDGAQDVAVSPDGTRAYVTQSDGKTVTVIDTRTNTVIGTVTTDQNPTTGAGSIAIGTDGILYVTDPSDGTLYAVSLSSPTVL
jgi:YVTN family beta-propeller protein